MSTATDAIRFIETLQKQGVKKQVATEIVSFVESQRGDLVTKQDLEPINQRLEWLKWITGGVIAVMIGGFTALLSLMIYLHSDTKAEMNRRFAEMNHRFEKIEQLLQRERK